MNALAYEDFLQSAETSIDALVERGTQASETGTVDEAAALSAANASHRLGAAACALGLGHVALLPIRSVSRGGASRITARRTTTAPKVRRADSMRPCPSAPRRCCARCCIRRRRASRHRKGAARFAALTAMIERPLPITRYRRCAHCGALLFSRSQCARRHSARACAFSRPRDRQPVSDNPHRARFSRP